MMEVILLQGVSSLRFENVLSLSLPGAEGELGVLPGHERALFLLREGKVRVLQKHKRQEFEIKRGLALVEKDKVWVWCEER